MSMGASSDGVRELGQRTERRSRTISADAV